MKTIKQAVFLKSISSAGAYQSFDMPEIILVGRSNVGKSSIINMLANNYKLAKVSSNQGKTRLINFFEINKEFILTDLPGYGFALASKEEQNRWKKMIDGYIMTSKNIKCAVLLVDMRHKPTAQDLQMFDFLTYNNIPVTIVATKYDKVKSSERIAKIKDIAATLKVARDNIYLTSSETGFGKQELIDRIYQFVEVADENLCD